MNEYYHSISDFRNRLVVEKETMTYDELVQKYGVNKFYLWHILNDATYEPPYKVCAALGIIALAPAPVCPECGEVHTTGFCTKGTAGVAPAPVCPKCGQVHVAKRCSNGKASKRTPRVSINLRNPESAAKTLSKYMDKETLAALVDYLVIARNDNDAA